MAVSVDLHLFTLMRILVSGTEWSQFRRPCLERFPGVPDGPGIRRSDRRPLASEAQRACRHRSRRSPAATVSVQRQMLRLNGICIFNMNSN